jgi:hypothetical protein
MEECAKLIWDPDNDIHWMNFFRQRHEFELAQYEGNVPPAGQQD